MERWDRDCGHFQLDEQQQQELIKARDQSGVEFPDKPLKREMEEPEQEPIWDKLRKHLPEILVSALIAAGAAATAAALVACFGSGACEFGLALAGVGVVLAAGISAALRAAGIEDRPSA